MSKTGKNLDRLKENEFSAIQAQALFEVMEDVLGEPLKKDMFEARLALVDQKIDAIVENMTQRLNAFEAKMFAVAKELELSAKNMEVSNAKRDRTILAAVVFGLITIIGIAARVGFYGLP